MRAQKHQFDIETNWKIKKKKKKKTKNKYNDHECIPKCKLRAKYF